MARRYSSNGERLWDGKTVEEFTEQDVVNFMQDTAQTVNAKEDKGMNTVESLMKVLSQNGYKEEERYLTSILNSIDIMQDKIKNMSNELHTVNQELRELKGTKGAEPVILEASKILKKDEIKINLMQRELNKIKKILHNKAGQIVNNFKNQGIKALNNMSKVLGVKEVLQSFQATFEKSSVDMERRINNISKFESKYIEASVYIKNAGKVLCGDKLEVKEQYIEKEKTIFSTFKKICSSMKDMCDCGVKEMDLSLAALNQLEKKSLQVNKETKKIAKKIKCSNR